MIVDIQDSGSVRMFRQVLEEIRIVQRGAGDSDGIKLALIGDGQIPINRLFLDGDT